MTNLSPAEQKTFFKHVSKTLLPRLKSCVIPIFVGYEDAGVQCGTGTLLRVADMSFLVTAAHVAGIRGEHGYELYVSDGTQGAKLLPLEGVLHRECDLDVAVWELPSQITANLASRAFLTVSQTDRANQRVTPGVYYIHGYPNCWSGKGPQERSVLVRALSYGTALYDGESSSFGGYSAEKHVLLTVPEHGNEYADGVQADMPQSLHGISGCSVWQAYYEGLPSDQWTIDDAMVVAVETGTYRGGRVVKGTRWCFVDYIISKNYPQLKEALSIITPYQRATTA